MPQQGSVGKNKKEGPRLRAVQFAEDMTKRPKRELWEINEQIIKLKTGLQRGNEQAIQEQDPKKRELAIRIGREVTQHIERLKERGEALKQEILKFGGNPDDLEGDPEEDKVPNHTTQ